LSEAPEKKLICWTLAEEYYHEAIEHAALVEGKDGLVRQVREAIHPFQEKAAISMGANPKEVDVV